MQIKLKTGLVVKLQWNWLVIERLEETVGSLDNLTKKKIKERGQTKTMGDIAYAVLQSNIDEEMTREELLSLVELKDVEKIADFVKKNNEKTDDFISKKNSNHRSQNHRKK